MSIHEMRLHAGPFEKIKNGSQTIESRVNDEKRQQFKVGDNIVFSLRPDLVEKVEAEIVELLHAPDFETLFAMRPLPEFGIAKPEDTKNMYEYYSKEEETKYGVVGIQFKKI